MASLSARWHRSISEIPEEQWDQLLGDQICPFYRWTWLLALERSGSMVILHLKGHSYGEFVSDQSFARLTSDLLLQDYLMLCSLL